MKEITENSELFNILKPKILEFTLKEFESKSYQLQRKNSNKIINCKTVEPIKKTVYFFELTYNIEQQYFTISIGENALRCIHISFEIFYSDVVGVDLKFMYNNNCSEELYNNIVDIVK